jgi:hypothetical protein
VTVTSLENRKPIATYPVTGHGQRAALHPSGKKLVVDMHVNLGILDLDSGRFTSPLCIGERHDLTKQVLWQARQMKEVQAQVNYEAMEQQLKKTLKKMGMDEPAIKDHLERHMKQMKDEAAKVGTPEWVAEQAPIQGSESPSAMAFNSDGSLLFCATSHGIRVYSWEEVLAAGEQMPRPLFAAKGKPVGEYAGSLAYTHAIAYDSHAGRVVFGGLGGAIEYLDLQTGASEILIEVPGQPAIHRLAFSRDGSTLASQAAGGRHRPPTIQIWNYSKL